MAILYHYTCLLHTRSILTSGYNRTTESNIDPHRPHAGPDVVWLTDQPIFDQLCVELPPEILQRAMASGLAPGDIDKKAVRFTVDVDGAVPWATFAKHYKAKKSWLRDLALAGDPSTWFVLSRPIPREEWLRVDNVRDNVVLWAPVVSA